MPGLVASNPSKPVNREEARGRDSWEMVHLPPTQVWDSLHPSCQREERLPRVSGRGPPNLGNPGSLGLLLGESCRVCCSGTPPQMTSSFVPLPQSWVSSLKNPRLPSPPGRDLSLFQAFSLTLLNT